MKKCKVEFTSLFKGHEIVSSFIYHNIKNQSLNYVARSLKRTFGNVSITIIN